MQPPLPNTPSAHRAGRLISGGPGGWRLGRLGRPGRVLGRLVVRLTRGAAPYQQEVDRHLLESIGHVDARVETIVGRLDVRDAHWARERIAVEDRMDTADQFVGDLARAIERMHDRMGGDERPGVPDLIAASRARPYVAEPGFETWDEPGAGKVLGFTGNEMLGATAAERYKLFEDRFRGPEKRVADLQRPYLQLLEGRGRVLDIGCGRGEMLDLLREHGIDHHGIDTDEAMIARCRAKGHEDAEVADANTHLRSVPDRHYGAIFSAQVVEHLPYAELNELLSLSARKLRPGGILIAETVNPHAPHALRAFWTDLTHQHPIFPEVALALSELAGFASAYVFHPTGTGTVDVDSWTESAYAVVAQAAGGPDQ